MSTAGGSARSAELVRRGPKNTGMSAGPRQPVIHVPHGGGPWPFVDLGGFVPSRDIEGLRAYFAALPAQLPAPPRRCWWPRRTGRRLCRPVVDARACRERRCVAEPGGSGFSVPASRWRSCSPR